MIYIEIHEDEGLFQQVLEGSTFKITKLNFDKETYYQPAQYEPCEHHKPVLFEIKTDLGETARISIDLGYKELRSIRPFGSSKVEDKSFFLSYLAIIGDEDKLICTTWDDNKHETDNLATERFGKELLKRTRYINERVRKEFKSYFKELKMEEDFK